MTAPGRVSWWTLGAVAGLAAAVVATFAAVRHGGFVGIDDGNNIFLNPQMGGLSWERVIWAFGDLGTARRYMPLGWLGFSTVISGQGLEPAGFHLASLGWHGLATLALFAATRNILRLRSGPEDSLWTTGLAFLVAAAWALHPMRTEAVAWASGLLYTQASAFAFAALWLWTLRWTCAARSGCCAVGSVLALAASLLTYPIALGLPVVCWLLDLVSSRSGLVTNRTGSWRVRFGVSPGLVALGTVAGAVLGATLIARRENSAMFAATAALDSFGVRERGLQALYVWGRYLVELVWPAQLSPVYTELYALRPFAPAVLSTILLSLALIGLSGWLAWRRIAFPLPLLAYSVMALPFLGLLEHPWIAHDRYAMLLHPVWLVAGAWGLVRLKTARSRAWVAGAAAGLVAAGAMQAHALIGVWAGQPSLLARLQQTLPRDAWAGYYLGNVPGSVLFLEGRFAEIGPVLDRAEAAAPGWSAAPARAEFAGLIRQHEEFLRQNWPGRALPPLAVLHYLHGQAAGSRQDWVAARAHYRAAQAAAGGFAEAKREEAWCELELHDPSAAATAMEQAVVLAGSPSAGPRETEFWRVLAAVHRARGDAARADQIDARAKQRQP